MVSTMTSPIRSSGTLTLETLVGVLESDEPAFTIPSFCAAPACDHIADRLVSSHKVGAYVVEPRFRRWGKSFYDTTKDPRLLDEYFAEALPDMQELRDLCRPFWCPIDQLRCKLDEVWPWGANIATLGGRKMKAGTARICFEGDRADAHVDSLGFDAKAFKTAPALKRQVSANIYLRTPPLGGALVLWPHRLVTAAEEAAYRLPSSKYALDEDKLGPPLPPVFPGQGDLIVFDTSHPHAVRPSFGGARVSMALFIGYAGEGQPLCMWN